MSALDFDTVVRVFKTNAVNVTRLRLYQQCPRPSDVKELAAALQANQTLVELNLSHNEALLSGTPILAESLKENTGIRKLVLNACRIGDRGATALADMLKTNTSIQTLHLKARKPNWR